MKLELTQEVDELDAKEIENLTQADMMTFFSEYISPCSSSRAKLSVHLLAAGSEGLSKRICVVGREQWQTTGRDEEYTADGRLYSLDKDGVLCSVERSAWKQRLSRISVAPAQDFTKWQMPTSYLASCKLD